MLERFKVVCISCKVLYKCSAFYTVTEGGRIVIYRKCKCPSVQKQEDVMQLRDRVDHLDSVQRHQLEELRSVPTYVMDRSGVPLNSDHYSDSPAGSVDSDRSSR